MGDFFFVPLGCCLWLSNGLLLLFDILEIVSFVTKGGCLSQMLGGLGDDSYFCRVIKFEKYGEDDEILSELRNAAH